MRTVLCIESRQLCVSDQGLAEISRAQERYMVAFQYGSVVFFNFDDEEEEEALCAVRKFCTDEFRETRKDGICSLPSSF